MKFRVIAALVVLVLAPLAHTQVTTLKYNAVATLPSAAATFNISPVNGSEATGPVLPSWYLTAATITSGVASCPAFVATSWTLAGTATVPVTSSAANAATFTYAGLTPGTIQCFAITNSFVAGGPPSAATITPPTVIIILGTAAAATNFGGSVSL